MTRRELENVLAKALDPVSDRPRFDDCPAWLLSAVDDYDGPGDLPFIMDAVECEVETAQIVLGTVRKLYRERGGKEDADIR